MRLCFLTHVKVLKLVFTEAAGMCPSTSGWTRWTRMEKRTPQSLWLTSMTGLVGTAVMESFDEESMTVIPSADRKKNDFKRKSVCMWV